MRILSARGRLAAVLVLSVPDMLLADVWIAGEHELARISPEGDVRASVTAPFGRSFAYNVGFSDMLEVDERDGSLWVTDVNNDRLMKLDADAQPLLEVERFSPFAIGIDPATDVIWISAEPEPSRAVIKLDARTGEELVRVTGFSSLVSAIAVGNDGAIWIADRNGGDVVRLVGSDEELDGYDASAEVGAHHRRFTDFSEPQDIDVDRSRAPHRDGAVWIADRNVQSDGTILPGKVVKLSASGKTLLRVSPSGFFEVRHLAIDPLDGSVWASDTNSGRVVHLSRRGQELANVAHPTAGAIEVDPTDGATWVAASDAVLKLDNDGIETLRLEGRGIIAGVAAYQPVVEVPIDVKPFDDRNRINPRAKGTLWVAILSDTAFDPLQVDTESVRLGTEGARAERHRVQDVNADGLDDLLLRFSLRDVEILCGDTTLGLTGRSFAGERLRGEDRIRTIGCRF